MERVGTILEREGEVLEVLLFKLVETRLLLEAGECRFLARASREVERSRTRARQVGLLRAATVALIQPGATLRDLAHGASGPWPAILRDHHDVLARVVAEIEVAAHHNDVAAQAGLDRLAQEHIAEGAVMAFASAPSPATDGDRHLASSARPGQDAQLDHLARGAAFSAVLGTAARLQMPELLDFLR